MRGLEGTTITGQKCTFGSIFVDDIVWVHVLRENNSEWDAMYIEDIVSCPDYDKIRSTKLFELIK